MLSASDRQTPGVYIVEKNAFPNSVVAVATAVPAFVGYTEKAEFDGKSLTNVPTRIGSMMDFHSLFGGASTPLFDLVEPTLPRPVNGFLEAAGAALKDPGPPIPVKLPTDSGEVVLDLVRSTPAYLLHAAMLLFFANGGGACWVVSVGSYSEAIETDRLLSGLAALEAEAEPTIVCIPEAMRLGRQDAMTVGRAMLTHCGVTMKSRFAILDLFGGWCDRASPEGDPVQAFREEIGTDELGYGAAYYPWLNTTLHQPTDFSFANLTATARAKLVDLVRANAKTLFPETIRDAALAEVAKVTTYPDPSAAETAAVTQSRAQLDQTLRAALPFYGEIMRAMARAENLVPPAAALAGIYAMTDNVRGVWKPPANVSVNSVSSPAVAITDQAQADLNVSPVDGKSINAIRAFVGQGVLVWGARTLDGNSDEWRYVSVRRTMIMIEQSIRLAVRAYVFEPNDSTTWTVVRSTIQNFLSGIWKQGGLAGATPDDAFAVAVGLGSTMTPQDILDGVLRVTVQLAVIRPAEFIVIAIEQKMEGG